MSTKSPTRLTDIRTMSETLAEAMAAAGHAPSIHNTAPWRWHAAGDTLDLLIERRRVLDITDPDARLATLSCGAALHHARASLAAQGWHVTVTRWPDPANTDHLASLQVSDAAPAARRAPTVGPRQPDRRPLGGAAVGPGQLDAITTAVEAEGALLHVLTPSQVLDLAAAAGQAQRAKAGDTAWPAEMDYWTGGPRAGELPASTRHDRSAMFAILYGSGDRPQDWLHAGEALSAASLTGTGIGVCVLPLSATIEMIGSRPAMRALLASVGFPYLVLRLGTNDPNAG